MRWLIVAAVKDTLLTTGRHRPPRPPLGLLAVLACLAVLAACDDPDDATPTADTTSEPAAGSDTALPNTAEPSTDTLETATIAILEAAMEPGAIDWTRAGLPAEPTAVTAGVRRQGHDDVLVVVGTQVDGSEAAASDPLPVGPLTGALVRTLALQLVDERVLDPAAAIETWAPALPASDVTTIQSLLEMTTGWSRWGSPGDDVVLDDLERRWTLSEVVELIGPTVTVDPQPSVATTDVLMTDLVLGHVLEQVTGESLAALVDERIASPLGLGDTEISDGAHPDRYRHGVFDLDGSLVDTSMFPGTAFFTWHTATHAAVSSVPDLLDLLDAWHSGELFTTDRTPRPERFTADRATATDDTSSYDGLGVPFNGYCPCTERGEGHDVAAIGRTPAGRVVGADLHALRYADGITVVVHFNSDQSTDRPQVRAIADAIHKAAVEAD